MTDDLARQQRFLLEAEQGIRLANREVLSKKIPPINSQSVLSFAVAVAKVRAEYLAAAFSFTSKNNDAEPIDQQAIDDLKEHRIKYEEAREAFEALKHAIEVGYIDLA